MSEHANITCPHCGTSIKVDTQAGVVVSHEAPVIQSEKADFDDRLKQLKNEQERAADRMAEAMRKEQSKGRIMEDRFKELLDTAKKTDDGSRPIKDIDLD